MEIVYNQIFIYWIFFSVVHVILVMCYKASGIQGRSLHFKPEQDVQDAGSQCLFSHVEVQGRVSVFDACVAAEIELK